MERQRRGPGHPGRARQVLLIDLRGTPIDPIDHPSALRDVSPRHVHGVGPHQMSELPVIPLGQVYIPVLLVQANARHATHYAGHNVPDLIGPAISPHVPRRDLRRTRHDEGRQHLVVPGGEEQLVSFRII